ncbi:glutamate receptor 2 [Calliphora vicina]|uniref:glutamate receptor 2 n=1 Tax=Calliphora vicina TaxID=7373 RepID=UPI00325C0C51
MYLSGSKVIAILCITTAISSGIEVLTQVQQRNFINNENKNIISNKTTSYELNVLNEFLDYNQLQRAIIIYTSSSATTLKERTQRCPDNVVKDNFVQLPLIRKLTENYHIQFVNTLSANNTEYLFQSFMRGIVVFMKYVAADNGKEMILKLVSMREKFNKSLVWLVLMEDLENPVASIREHLGYLNIMMDADVTVAVYRKEPILDLYDIYKICHDCGSSLEVEYKGKWSAETGFKILNKFHYGIAIRRNNFKNFSIKASTAILNKPANLNLTDFEYLNNDKEFMEDDAMQRKTYQMMKLLANMFNFTYDIYYKDKWGAETNGSWSGVIGLLDRHQVELSLCPLRYLIHRLKAFDYSRNIHTEKIHFLFRHPKRSSIRNIFVEPLADVVWWCVLALIVVTILLLTIHVHTEYKLFAKLQRQHQQQQQQQHQNHFDFIVFCIMEAILMQGPTPELFRCNSTRLLVVSVSIFSILLMQFYGAFIVSSLLSEPPRTITNLQALYNSSLELGMENVSYNYEVFINSTNPLVRNLYKYRICNKHTNHHNIMTLAEGVKRIGKGNFAFHVAIDRAYRLLTTFLTESEFCDLQEVNFHQSFTFASGVGIRKSSPYYEFITLSLAMFQEAALLPYNDKKWEVNKIDCSTIKSDEVEVDLEHFAPALVFLLLAILISATALIIEIIYKKYTMRTNLYIAYESTTAISTNTSTTVATGSSTSFENGSNNSNKKQSN